ncbi:MAG: hypothetical protein LIP23_03515 [Planctomycetes bacterium]|nr:hypothetical protein [Planctomycetota bacterium]
MADNQSNVLSPAVLGDMNSFDKAKREEGLAVAAAAVRDRHIVPPAPTGWVNVHCHTFFSYSSEEYSPTRLTWEALMRGLSVVGSTDFDVLDAMDEMYQAGDQLGIRTTVALETRTFVDSYADKEINSPGEPGVMYNMGVGFVRLPQSGDAAGKLFASLREQSRSRNVAMVDKVNAVTAPVRVDYEKDVLPLTPSGNATERHICAAYDNVARRQFADAAALAEFWSRLLGRSRDETAALLADGGAFRNAIRAKLMKKGGPGYAQPDRGAFPPVKDFFTMVAAAKAMPCLAWLDGLTAGEAEPNKLLDDGLDWGIRAVNVIPDRNWNFADPEVKVKKLAGLEAFMQAARKRNLPILAGTEMNSPGQKFVDSFDAPELAPYIKDFQDSAYWLYGHTVLERAASMGVMSDWAGSSLPDWAAANAFYIEIGKKAEPGPGLASVAGKADPGMKPEQVSALFE